MRRRTVSSSSSRSSLTSSFVSDSTFQELDTLYDYLSKIILLGPSGCGKSCILHRFVKNEWQVLTSQTVGVEFASKIVKIGQGTSMKRIKLQLWDTAGQERFRALTRGYYRGSAGVLLIYDVTSRDSFLALGEFIKDVRALTAPSVSIVVLGNKSDLRDSTDPTMLVPESDVEEFCKAQEDVTFLSGSALTGENVEEAFQRLAGIILTKIEMGEIDPENMDSGVQYGEVPRWDRNSSTRRTKLSGTLLGNNRGGVGRKTLSTLMVGSGNGPENRLRSRNIDLRESLERSQNTTGPTTGRDYSQGLGWIDRSNCC